MIVDRGTAIAGDDGSTAVAPGEYIVYWASGSDATADRVLASFTFEANLVTVRTGPGIQRWTHADAERVLAMFRAQTGYRVHALIRAAARNQHDEPVPI